MTWTESEQFDDDEWSSFHFSNYSCAERDWGKKKMLSCLRMFWMLNFQCFTDCKSHSVSNIAWIHMSDHQHRR